MDELGTPNPEGAEDFKEPSTAIEQSYENRSSEKLTEEQERLYKSLAEKYTGLPSIKEMLLEQAENGKTEYQFTGQVGPDGLTEAQKYKSLGCGLEDLKAAKEEMKMLYRHAFATGVDCIIFLDTSARRAGELASDIFPIMQLEYSKLFDKPLNHIKRPEIIFVKPKHQTDALDEQQVKDLLGEHLSGKRTIIFDESSTEMNGRDKDPVCLEPKDQYDFFDQTKDNPPEITYSSEKPSEIENDSDWEAYYLYRTLQDLDRRKDVYLKENRDKSFTRGNVGRVASVLTHALPNTDIQTHVGLSGRKGGNLGRIIPAPGFIQTPETGIFSDKKADSPGHESAARRNLKMVAKEIFDDVTKSLL